MSFVLRTIIALVITVFLVSFFIAYKATDSVTDLITNELSESLKTNIRASTENYRFALFSKSQEDIDEWIRTVESHPSVEAAAIDERPNFELDESHFELSVPIVFLNGERPNGYQQLNLIVSSKKSEIRQTVISTMIATTILAAGIATIIIIVFTLWLKMPVTKLAEQFKNLAPNDLQNQHLIRKKVPKELLPVIDTGNDLLERFKDYVNNLDSMVEERTYLLKSAIADNELKDKQKDTLISSLSHDLKTPLSAILTYLELMKDDMEEDDFSEFEDNIRQSIKCCIAMEQEIKSIIKLASAEVSSALIPKIYDIEHLIRQTLSEQSILTKESKNTISLSIKGNKKAKVVRHVFSHVLTNLLSNSNKYTKNGNIKIFAIVDSNLVTISVHDVNSNITQKKINTLFEGSPDKLHSGTGSGVGLSICKVMLEKINGEITAAKGHPSGLFVTFSMPNGGRQRKGSV